MSDQRPDRLPPRKNGRNPLGNSGGGPGAGGMRFGRGVFGWVLFVLLAVMLFVLVNQNRRSHQDVDIGTFITALKNNQVKTVTIDGDELSGQFTGEIAAANSRGEKVEYFRTHI